MSRGAAVTTKIAFLGKAWDRARLRMGANRDGIVDEITVLVPPTRFISSDAENAGKRGWQRVRSTWRRRRDYDETYGMRLRHQCGDAVAMIRVGCSEAQVDNMHVALNGPTKACFEHRDGGGKRVVWRLWVPKDLHGVEFRVWSFRLQDTGQGSAMAATINVIF